MLVLSRKPDQTICVGPNIHITVIGIQGGRVRIGIKAPRDVPIHRAEVQQWIEAERAIADADADCVPIA